MMGNFRAMGRGGKDNAETQRAQRIRREEKPKSTGRSACATRVAETQEHRLKPVPLGARGEIRWRERD